MFKETKVDSKGQEADKAASVFLRLRPDKNVYNSVCYVAEKNVLKVYSSQDVTKDVMEKHFEFSKVFHADTKQFDIYNHCVRPSIENDTNLSVLTYGTSGSGKTYTMYGTKDDAGIVQRAIVHIFTKNEKIICRAPEMKVKKCSIEKLSKRKTDIESQHTAKYVRFNSHHQNDMFAKRICDEHHFKVNSTIDRSWQYVYVWLSFVEIYNENIYDLLRTGIPRTNLKIILNDGNVYISDLTSVHVSSASDAFEVINAALDQASYARTKINSHSSRSHSILIINVIQFSRPSLFSLTTYTFCDLAGSERLKKTDHLGDRLKETQRTNVSLMVLGRCFQRMQKNQQLKSKGMLPIRESKLTLLLQKSLLGKEKIVTIVTVTPNIKFMNENLHVLKFASIAQQIVYKQVNIPDLEADIERLKAENLFLRGECDNFHKKNADCEKKV